MNAVHFACLGGAWVDRCGSPGKTGVIPYVESSSDESSSDVFVLEVAAHTHASNCRLVLMVIESCRVLL